MSVQAAISRLREERRWLELVYALAEVELTTAEGPVMRSVIEAQMRQLVFETAEIAQALEILRLAEDRAHRRRPPRITVKPADVLGTA